MTIGPIDILLVDDEPRNLDVLESILAGPSYRLLRAEDADQALRMLLENDVAAIVLDIKMPHVSGFELAQIIKRTKRFRETPIVFLTAYMLDDQHVIAGYGAGAVDYLTKPVSPEVLRHKVAIFAELYRKTRELAELNSRLEERVKERTAELEASEAALRKAASQKDEFIATLAHELRNPLAPLRMGLDVLNMRDKSPRNQRTLASMNRQLQHMVRLIDDLLDVSRISRGVLELQRERVDVAAAVEATIEPIRQLFEKKGQTLSLTLEDGAAAHADATRLAQIVTNLVTNAAKFTPAGGRVSVEARREGDRVAIRVSDSGLGIPPQQIDRVFEMFARVERPGVSTQDGLGIGLALARRLAELHGGTLTAASAGEGRGSTFTLLLPAAASAGIPVVEEALAGAARPAPPSLRVVVIEDNGDVAETLITLLEEMGHRVWLAHTGNQGLALVQQEQPNVVLCDLGLPEMGGVEVCRRVRALPGPRQPVMVALTGWGRSADRQETRDAGFDHHLVKPIGAMSLDRLLRTVAGSSSAPS
jgi:signal transduction histidine kinase